MQVCSLSLPQLEASPPRHQHLICSDSVLGRHWETWILGEVGVGLTISGSLLDLAYLPQKYGLYWTPVLPGSWDLAPHPKAFAI